MPNGPFEHQVKFPIKTDTTKSPHQLITVKLTEVISYLSINNPVPVTHNIPVVTYMPNSARNVAMPCLQRVEVTTRTATPF